MRGLLIGVAMAMVAGSAVADPALHAAAETAVKSTLVDPDSAEFRSEADATMEWMKQGIFSKRVEGPIALVCGEYNSKNRMGGYGGYSWFYAAFKDGHLLWTVQDEATDPGPGTAYYVCKNAGAAS